MRLVIDSMICEDSLLKKLSVENMLDSLCSQSLKTLGQGSLQESRVGSTIKAVESQINSPKEKFKMAGTAVMAAMRVQENVQIK